MKTNYFICLSVLLLMAMINIDLIAQIKKDQRQLQTRKKRATYQLVFDETGKLLSAPPTFLYVEDKMKYKSFLILKKNPPEIKVARDGLQAKVQVSGQYLKSRTLKVLDHYLKGFESVNTKDMSQYLINDWQRARLACEYASEIKGILTSEYGEYIENKSYYEQILASYSFDTCDRTEDQKNRQENPKGAGKTKNKARDNCDDGETGCIEQIGEIPCQCSDLKEENKLLPSAPDLILPRYKFLITSYLDDGTIEKRECPPVCDPIAVNDQCEVCPDNSMIVPFAIGSLPENTNKIEFELVEQNPYWESIEGFLASFPIALAKERDKYYNKNLKISEFEDWAEEWECKTKKNKTWLNFKSPLTAELLFSNLIKIDFNKDNQLLVKICEDERIRCGKIKDSLLFTFNTTNTKFVRLQNGHLVISGKLEDAKEFTIEVGDDSIICQEGPRELDCKEEIVANELLNDLKPDDYKDFIEKGKNYYRKEDLSVLKEWYKKSFWISGEPRINPFKLVFGNNAIKSEVQKGLDRHLNKLMVINAQIELYKKQITGKNCSNCTTSATQGTLNELSRLIDGSNKLGDSIKLDSLNLKKAVKAEAQQKEFDSLLFANQFLYHGELFASRKDTSNFMRHHDRLIDYGLMNKHYKDEIKEDESVFIIGENLFPKKQLSLQSSVSAVIPKSLLAEELIHPEKAVLNMAMGKKADPLMEKAIPLSTPSKTPPLPPTSDISVLNYFKIDHQIAYNMQLFKAGFPNLPLAQINDPEPNYVGQRIPITHPQKGPAIVKYEIKEDPKASKPDLSSSFRVNKLFKFRFRSGLLYSLFEREDITVENNVVSISGKRHGVDGTFGLQFFIKRYDIRSGQMTPVLYAGLGMRDPLRNLYLGAGLEVYSGVSVVGGFHISQTDKLSSNGGVFEVERDQWAANSFISVLLDVEVFTKFIGLRTNSLFQTN